MSSLRTSLKDSKYGITRNLSIRFLMIREKLNINYGKDNNIRTYISENISNNRYTSKLISSNDKMELQNIFYETLLRLKELPVTIALGSHPGHTHMLERYAAKKGNENPLIDPQFWPAFMAERAEAFRREIL